MENTVDPGEPFHLDLHWLLRCLVWSADTVSGVACFFVWLCGYSLRGIFTCFVLCSLSVVFSIVITLLGKGEIVALLFLAVGLVYYLLVLVVSLVCY